MFLLNKKTHFVGVEHLHGPLQAQLLEQHSVLAEQVSKPPLQVAVVDVVDVVPFKTDFEDFPAALD